MVRQTRAAGGGNAGRPNPTPALVDDPLPTTEPRAGPVDELRATGASPLRIEEVDGQRAGDRAADDRPRRRAAAARQPLACRLRLLADLRAHGLLGRRRQLARGIAGSTGELLSGPADPVRDVIADLFEINLLEIRHHASPPPSLSRRSCSLLPAPGCRYS